MNGRNSGGTSIVWLRRDLRLDDNAALYEAARHSERLCVAVVLQPPQYLDALGELRANLRAMGGDLAILSGEAAVELAALAKRIGARAVYFAQEYDPAAVRRDAHVESVLRSDAVRTARCLDHVYFGADEVLQNNGAPYRVFTPYKRRWLEQRAISPRLPIPSRQAMAGRLVPREAVGPTHDVAASGAPASICESAAQARFEIFLNGAATRYKTDRNVPAIDGTSRLSADLRAGTIGVRTCVERAMAAAGQSAPAVRDNILTWVSQLIWRDFYQAILKHFPHVETEPFLDAARHIRWRTSPADFAAWCEGRTGYPIVDAGMRQLNQTGWMHNRLRMIAASFLTKDLLIDWREGASYFERMLIDADLAQNNGGWQWAASTGTDAVPYFRIFNPTLQGQQFDPSGEFIKRFVPELQAGGGYPAPIVDHRAARLRALAAFAPVMAPLSRTIRDDARRSLGITDPVV